MMPQQRGTRTARWGAVALTAGALTAAGCSASATKPAASSGSSKPASPSATASGNASGNGGGSLTAAEAVKQAAAQAQKASSYAADVTVRTTGTAATTISGTLQQRTEPSPLAVADFGSVTVQGQPVQGGIDEIISSSGVYLKMAPLAKETGKPWLEIPASEMSQVSGASFSQLLQNGSNDPLVQAQMLSSSTNVKKVGPATINGVPTTEYTGTYPISAGLAKLPAASRSKISSQLQQMGLTTEQFTVWLDGQQQVRKVVSSAKGTSESVASTIVVTSVNQPVSGSIPPAAQVATVPASELGGSGGSGSTSS
ncbi:MAG TPA: hypothetical protein VHW06_09930 [Streptosporangiaceae bacterium]|jgi:hypothetical protein|nr:hypothetical protein [Streptosporangiaceae bacterium]